MKCSTLLLTIAAVVVLRVSAVRAELVAENANFNGLQVVAEDFANAFTGDAKAVQHFAQNLAISTDVFLKVAEEYGRGIAEAAGNLAQASIQDLLSALETLRLSLAEQLAVISDQTKKILLQGVHAQLVRIEQSARSLLTNVRDVRVKWRDQIISQDQQILQSWNVWASSQLDKVTNGDEPTIEEIDKVINEFINRYGNHLNSCADEAETELKRFESNVQTVIEGYESVVEQLVVQIEACLKAEDSIEAIAACRGDVGTALEDLRRAAINFARLSVQGVKLVRVRYNRRSCIVQTLAQFRLERFSVQRKIDQIIAEHEATNNQSAASDSSDSTESGGSSESSDSSGSSGTSESSE